MTTPYPWDRGVTTAILLRRTRNQSQVRLYASPIFFNFFEVLIPYASLTRFVFENADLAFETLNADLTLEDADLAFETLNADLALELLNIDLAFEALNVYLAFEVLNADLVFEVLSMDLMF